MFFLKKFNYHNIKEQANISCFFECCSPNNTYLFDSYLYIFDSYLTLI